MLFQVSRVGSSHQAGSDSLLTASTFFKMRDVYFSDPSQVASFDSEYSLKLYGLGQTFSVSNGLPDPGRGGATIAEREDRGSTMVSRESNNQTPGSNGHNQNQNQNNHSNGMGMILPIGSGGISAPMPSTAYGPMGVGGPYMRTSQLVGGR